ncbi:hypothetical protein HYW18_02700 [Candidatus Uhrbacteria bacterium]|nr:hypothetical protein [Candidatus Uhrbacteria bacterium]
MKMLFPENYHDSSRNLIMRCGYAEFRDPKTGKISYVRRPGQGFYPRFHVYLQTHPQGFVVDIHLDQKQPSYGGGTHMHSGEYTGTAVHEELARIAEHITGRKS